MNRQIELNSTLQSKVPATCYLQPVTCSCEAGDGRIGLFGGTFDPIHLGHLILAETAFEKLKLDQLILIPAKISPYKTNQPPAASTEDRLAMMELAIRGRNGWSIDPRELSRTGPSFTIDTVKELQQEHRGATFVFLIGEDQLAGLPGWKESERLQKLISFVVLSRNSMTDSISRNSIADPILLGRCIDISSTEIRERLAKNKNVDYLLPSSIHDYIKTKKLYQKSDY